MTRSIRSLGFFSLSALAVLLSVGALPAAAQSLVGSSASLDIQNRIAREHDFTYISTANQLRRFARSGYLVEVNPNGDFDLHAVSFPYARAEVELFIRRLASQYRASCGEKLVVTSLSRPLNMQPANASDRSVHPTGMAVDLRRSSSSRCRAWLENVLLSLEGNGVLEATRERYPSHYHVALFPRQYASYVDRRVSTEALANASSPGVDLRNVEYRVRSGDSLWTIARRLGTTVDRLKNENGLSSNRIYAGQVIEVPASTN